MKYATDSHQKPNIKVIPITFAHFKPLDNRVKVSHISNAVSVKTALYQFLTHMVNDTFKFDIVVWHIYLYKSLYLAANSLVILCASVLPSTTLLMQFLQRAALQALY